MHFTDIFIRRPVFASALSLLLVLIGLRSYFSLPVRQYPNIEPSVININTTYPGATAPLMEGFITTPLENSLGGIDGIDFIDSASTAGSSSITIQFILGYDINTAMADVSNAVTSMISKLPKGINYPSIARKDPSATPTVYIGFMSPTLKPEQITDYLLRVAQPQLQTLPGVSQALIFGSRQYAMRLWLESQRMAAHGITPGDILLALANQNVLAAPGVMETPWQELNMSAETDLTTPTGFNSLVVKNTNGILTRIKDIGFAVLGPQNDQVSIKVRDAKNIVVIGVIPQPTGNPLAVSQEVSQLLPQLTAAMPSNVSLKILWDSSKFIVASLQEVRKTIIEATLFVAIIIFLFLGSLRAIVIPLITIPLSLIGVCAIMLALGYSINVLTLLAWVLAIGLVVDDAIVVLENIHRHIEEGNMPFNAAIVGAREIGFAVIAMTLTLAAVYAPIGFLTDITGRLFREFSFTLAAAVIVSGFTALTLSPMMSSRILQHATNKQGLAAKIDEIFDKVRKFYQDLLDKTLNKRIWVLGGATIIYLACYLLFTSLPAELAPTEDQGALLGIVTGPSAANLLYTQKYTQELANIYDKLPEMEDYGIINGIPDGVNTAFSFLVLKPWSERQRTAMAIEQSLAPEVWAIPGIRAFLISPAPLPGTSGKTPVEFVLKTTQSYDELNNATQKLLKAASANPSLLNMDTDLKLDKPQVNVSVDRDKANALGISMYDVAGALNILLGEPTPAQFNMLGRSYYVIPELLGEYKMTPQELDNINLRTGSGQLIPFSNIAKMNVGVSPISLNHFQQLRSSTITASLAPGYTQGQALDYLQALATQILPHTMQIDYGGQSRQYQQASASTAITFALAVIFIFLILAAQFESYRDALIVLVSVPLSLTGALICLHLTGATLNIYTKIGLVTLIGLITKHGILMVEFANQIQRKGVALRNAIIEAAALRLRPILMTTGAMLLGALPLVLSTGAGAVSRNQLGWTIFGGMAFGTLFTLFVVPTVYTYLATHKSAETESDTPTTPY